MSASSATSLGTDVLAPGTELIVDRLAYRHLGIYLGEGLVVHYAGRVRYPHGLIEAVPLRSFVGNRRVHVGRGPAGSLHGEAVVRRACSRLGECRYTIFTNNCEHFCTWCQVGESRSRQVDRLLLRLRALRCAVSSILPRRCGSYLKRGYRIVLSSKSIAAKCLLRFSAAGRTVPTAWESRAFYAGGR
jgi:Lecithin retinol acyltransferase